LAHKYLKTTKPKNFTADYKEDCFYQWYSLGKPSMQVFSAKANPDIDGFVPSKASFDSWSKEWRERARILDEQVMRELETRMVAEKVEMLRRHADVGKDMQDIAIEYLDKEENIKKVTPSVALRLLVEGIKIERASRGMPDVLEEAINKSDEELMDDIAGLFEKTNMEITEDEGEPPNHFLPDLQG